MRHVFTFATACSTADRILLSITLNSLWDVEFFSPGPLERHDLYAVYSHITEISYLIRQVLQPRFQAGRGDA